MSDKFYDIFSEEHGKDTIDRMLALMRADKRYEDLKSYNGIQYKPPEEENTVLFFEIPLLEAIMREHGLLGWKPKKLVRILSERAEIMQVMLNDDKFRKGKPFTPIKPEDLEYDEMKEGLTMKKLDILVDFDGTVCTHEFPEIGKDIGAVPVLKRLIKAEHRLILCTMRSDMLFVDRPPRYFLKEAVAWFEKNDIPLYGVNVHPTQESWTDSRKCYGHLMIDDTGLGMPLIFDPSISKRPFVNWQEVKYMLIARDIIGVA